MKLAQIKGTITLTDGSTAQFRIGTDGYWSQWGHDDPQSAGQFVDGLDAIAESLIEGDLLISDGAPEPNGDSDEREQEELDTDEDPGDGED